MHVPFPLLCSKCFRCFSSRISLRIVTNTLVPCTVHDTSCTTCTTTRCPRYEIYKNLATIHKCTTSEQDRSLERVCVKRAEERSWPRARDDRWALHFNHGRQGPGEAGGVATRHLKLAVAGPTAVRDAQSHPRRARHRFMPATTGGPPTLLHCDVASRP